MLYVYVHINTQSLTISFIGSYPPVVTYEEQPIGGRKG